MKSLSSMIFSAIASFYYLQELLNILRRAIAPEACLTRLYIPCSTGTLLDLCLPCTYTGLDVDVGRVDKARLENGRRGTFQVGDAPALNFPDNNFDRKRVSGLFHRKAQASI